MVSSQDIVNPKFDKKVDGMISYHVPVISVEKACNDTISGYIFLDAREKEEYDVSHIPKARYIGYDNFNTVSYTHLTLPTICSV